MSLSKLLRNSALRWTDKVALWFAEERWTFEQLDRASSQVAAGLQAAGVKAGDRVALFMPNCVELVFSYFGIFKLGAIAVPLNARYRVEEAEYALEHSGARTVIVHEKMMAEAAKLPFDKLGIRNCYQIRGIATAPFKPFADLLAQKSSAFTPIEVDEDSPAAILYTSGSTARPKGVTLTYAGFWRNCQIQVKSFEFTDDDVHLVATAACHCAALGGQLLPSFLSGGTVVLTHVPEPLEFVKSIEIYGVTRTQLLPASLEDVVEYLEQNPGKHIWTWKSQTVGGDKTPLELQKRFQKIAGFEVTELYGLTEAVTVMTNPPFGEKRPGSIGKPLVETLARIVDANDQELPIGEVGELCLKTPAVMSGYWNDPEATAATIRNDWLHTGDLAHRDPDGYYWFVGRKKEIIIRGGSNISPMEVEAVIDEHPAVHLSCVVGKPDAHFGQHVVAYVELRADVVDKPTAEQIQQFVASKIAVYKVPAEVTFVENLPLNANGKVDRKQIHAVCGEVSLAVAGQDRALPPSVTGG
jgi:long-chain acyl-CoA synthetase